MNNHEQNSITNNVVNVAIGMAGATFGLLATAGSAVQLYNGYNSHEDEKFLTATAVAGASAMVLGASFAHSSAMAIGDTIRQQSNREQRLGQRLRQANQLLETANQPTITEQNTEISDTNSENISKAPENRLSYEYHSQRSKLEIKAQGENFKYSYESKENGSTVEFKTNDFDIDDTDIDEPEMGLIALKSTANALRKIDGKNQNNGRLNVEIFSPSNKETSFTINSTAKPSKHAEVFDSIANGVEAFSQLDNIDSDDEPEVHAKKVSTAISKTSDAISEILLASQTSNSNEKTFASKLSQTDATNSSFVAKAEGQKQLERIHSM